MNFQLMILFVRWLRIYPKNKGVFGTNAVDNGTSERNNLTRTRVSLLWLAEKSISISLSLASVELGSNNSHRLENEHTYNKQPRLTLCYDEQKFTTHDRTQYQRWWFFLRWSTFPSFVSVFSPFSNHFSPLSPPFFSPFSRSLHQSTKTQYLCSNIHTMEN